MDRVCVCCVLGLKDCPKHQDCSICVKDGLNKSRVEGAIKELELLEQAFRNGDTNTCSFKSFLLWKKQRLKVLGGKK